jgi:hypothetical protein
MFPVGLKCRLVRYGWQHGGTWSNHTYVTLALSSLLATCVVSDLTDVVIL